jgi:hypothetical protein
MPGMEFSFVPDSPAFHPGCGTSKEVVWCLVRNNVRDCPEMLIISYDCLAVVYRGCDGMRNITGVAQSAKFSRLELALKARYEWKDLQGQSKDLF